MSTPAATGAAEAQGETLNRSGSAIEHAVASRPHERLTRAMLEVSAEAGCRQASIARVAARAGMSSATFYEQFTGKEECLLEAYAMAARIVAGNVAQAARGTSPGRGVEAALAQMLDNVAADPAAGHLLFVEAPPPERDGGQELARYERIIEGLLEDTARRGAILDLPHRAAIGAIRSAVSRRLRGGECDGLTPLAQDLGAWLRTYAATCEPCWSTSPDAVFYPTPEPLPLASRMRAPRPTAPLSPGRHGLSAARVAQNHRERIVHAVAAVVLETGYAKMTVADIVLRAGIARDAFYRQHEDKRDAFLAAQLHGRHENTLAAARGYFEGRTWTERMWNLLQSHATFIAEQPALAHLRYVEPAVVGREAVAGLEEEMLKFATYVSEGYRHGARATQMPALSAEAITGAIFEILRHEIAQRRADTILRRLPQLTYIATAPFIGQRRAIREVERVALARVRQ